MSIIGIDVGSSGTKIAAYDLDGKPICTGYAAHSPNHPFPGAWELDPEEVWNRAAKILRQLISSEPMRRAAPRAIAVSASTREGFPVDACGRPLGPCIMTADTRESGVEKTILSAYTPEQWFAFCGHTPERMDPICRLLWWKRHHPEVIDKAAYFVGWGEFFSLRLTGKAVVDKSHAARSLVYDFKTSNWSSERISQFEIDPALLPEIKSWGTVIDSVQTEVSAKLGFSSDVELAVGANDAVCSVLGAGVSKEGTGCYMSGSWEDLLLPVTIQPPASVMINAGLSIGPYPGKAGWLIYSLSPTGSAVLNWVRQLVNVEIDEMEASLRNSGEGPGHVLAVPYVSGATVVWAGGSVLRAALLGMTLATSGIDVVRAFLESIAYDTYYLIQALKNAGIQIDMLRAVGGGVRSEWWTQLKADLTATVIETVDQPELGTLGAALLAGKALGVWDDIEVKAGEFTRANRRYNPDEERANMYRERMELYRSLITDWLSKDWSALSKAR